MNGDEIVTVIDVLQAAWPRFEWNEKTLALWCDAIQDLDAVVALTTARAVVRKHDWPPSIAVFLSEARNEAERVKPSYRALPAPENPTGRERYLAIAREVLERQRGKEHDHHGPDPCPVCGGRRPGADRTRPGGDAA